MTRDITLEELLEARERELNAFEEDGDAWHYEEIDAIDEILDGLDDETIN